MKNQRHVFQQHLPEQSAPKQLIASLIFLFWREICSLKKYEWSMYGVWTAVHFMICQASHSVTWKKGSKTVLLNNNKNWHGVPMCDFFGTNTHSPIKFLHLLISARNDTWILNYPFNLSKIFSWSLLQIFEVVQISPDFGPDYLD